MGQMQAGILLRVLGYVLGGDEFSAQVGWQSRIHGCWGISRAYSVLSPRGLGYLGYAGSVGYFDRLGWASTTKGAGVQPGRCRVLGPRYEM